MCIRDRPLGLSPALSPYEHVTERLGYGVAGFHGGSGINDDLEWTWSANGVVRAIRTLSAGLHDGEEQNGRLSVGEGDVPAGGDPASRLGSTWDRFAYKDHQEYPGAMENHSAGPSPIYGTTLFGLVPVSYTHLDVYKRQASARAGSPRSIMAPASWQRRPLSTAARAVP